MRVARQKIVFLQERDWFQKFHAGRPSLLVLLGVLRGDCNARKHLSIQALANPKPKERLTPLITPQSVGREM